MNPLLAELADDAATLARLHDRELDTATLAALQELGFPDNLALLPRDAADQAAWQAMREALAAVPPAPTLDELDALAAAYAALYLTGTHGISPCESVWLDEDRLTCRAPMFELRALYRAAGLAAADWRRRPDDHLVLQLLYLAHQLRRGASADFAADELAGMLDAHLLRWLPDFAGRIAACGAAPFYAGLAGLTLAWCRTLRAALGTTHA